MWVPHYLKEFGRMTRASHVSNKKHLVGANKKCKRDVTGGLIVE